MELPGAETCGFCPPLLAGPRELKEAMASVLVVAPTAMTSAALSAGEPVVRQLGPLLALAKTGMTPAECQARMVVSYQLDPPVPPQELLDTSGAKLQSGLVPW